MTSQDGLFCEYTSEFGCSLIFYEKNLLIAILHQAQFLIFFAPLNPHLANIYFQGKPKNLSQGLNFLAVARHLGASTRDLRKPCKQTLIPRLGCNQ